MYLHSNVRDALTALANYVEANGAGALRGTSEVSQLNLAQVDTYARFYEGLKREAQEQSIETNLIPEGDPLYGWGWLAQHEPTIRLIGAPCIKDIDAVGVQFKEERLAQKREQKAELHVVKRNKIVPTVPMQILHAIIEPIELKGLHILAVKNRMNRMKHQTKSVELLERINKLKMTQTPTGVLIQYNSKPVWQVGQINPQAS